MAIEATATRAVISAPDKSGNTVARIARNAASRNASFRRLGEITSTPKLSLAPIGVDRFSLARLSVAQNHRGAE